MQPYRYLSQIYDILQEEIDYQAWYHFFCNWANKQGYTLKNILELGAGTGNMTAHFIADNTAVTVLEPSEAMLQALVVKFDRKRRLINCFCGDVNSFQTAQTYDATVGFLDVLNYIAATDLSVFFKRVAKLTKVGGLVYFDISTPYKLKHVLGDNTFAESFADFAYIWHNQYDKINSVLDFDLSIFTENDNGYYQRQTEKHRQYAHTIDQIVAALPAELRLIEVLGEQFAECTSSDQRQHIFIERV